MFEDIYREAHEKLLNDIRRLVAKLMFDNAGRTRAYRDGLAEACEAFLQLVSDSSGDLIVALDREAEKEAGYYEACHASDVLKEELEQEENNHV